MYISADYLPLSAGHDQPLLLSTSLNRRRSHASDATYFLPPPASPFRAYMWYASQRVLHARARVCLARSLNVSTRPVAACDRTADRTLSSVLYWVHFHHHSSRSPLSLLLSSPCAASEDGSGTEFARRPRACRALVFCFEVRRCPRTRTSSSSHHAFLP